MRIAHVSLDRFTFSAIIAIGSMLSGTAPAVFAQEAIWIRTWSPHNPALPATIAPGAAADISIFSIAPEGGTYQWLHNGQPIPGATDPIYRVASATAADTGNYQLRFSKDGRSIVSDTKPLNVIPLPHSPVDTSFSAALPLDFSYREVLTTTADGGVVFVVSDSPTRDNPDGPAQIFRLNRDGSVAHAFTVASGGRYGVLAAFPDGGVILDHYPYRKKKDGTDMPITLPPGFDTTQPLTAAAAQPDGKFLIAQQKRLARFNADGSVDPGFSYTGPMSSTTSVLNFAFDAQGRIYAHGSQGAYPDAYGVPTAQTSVAFRLLIDGSQDLGFRPQYQEGASHVAYTDSVVLNPLHDGRILRTGRIANTYEPSWAMLRDDGTVDPAWSAPALTTPWYAVAVDRAHLRLFYTDAETNVIRRAAITATSLVEDIDFYPGDGDTSPGYYNGHGLYLNDQGDLFITSRGTLWDGHHSGGLFRLRSSDHSVVPPAVTIRVPTNEPKRGDVVELTSAVRGTGPLTYQWLALDGQPLPGSSQAASLTISRFEAIHLGRYQLRVTNAQGTAVLSNVIQLRMSLPPFLANLSGRAIAGVGEDTVIAGIVTGGYAAPLVRGAGPALGSLGIAQFLPNPVIRVFNAPGALISSNDNWEEDSDRSRIAYFAARAGAFTFAPGSLDAATLPSFSDTGAFSVQLSDRAGAAGVGLLEIYSSPSYGSGLVNLSFRARTAPGNATAIAGFVIVDPQGFHRSAKVLLRAVGPTLAQSGVAHPLENPILTVYNSKGEVIAQNDNWSVANASGDPATLSTAMKSVGAFDLAQNSKDAALLLDLPAGSYSMHATGGSGIVLLEIYLVQ